MRPPREIQVFVHRAPGHDSHEVLVLRRSVRHGGYWHTVAGAVEPEEAGADAALRELSEETGLDGRLCLIDLAHDYCYPIELETPDRRKLYSPDVTAIVGESFAVEVPPGWEPHLNAEHDSYRWCTIAEAQGLVYWSETKRALGRLAELLRQHR
jgi:8-oxo-dGTP pyrophosphatase MutT (NUDIX family)